MDIAIFFGVLSAFWVVSICYTLPLAYISYRNYMKSRGGPVGEMLPVLGFLIVLACGPILIGIFNLEIRNGAIK